jgi:hypothetical protein
MTTANQSMARCACGRVELEVLGSPILGAACYCDDCQEGARQIEALPDACPVLGADGGTEYLLYRKDRMRCSKGSELMRDYKITTDSPTRRVVATCCSSAMFLDFQKGHWFSMYRARFGGNAPPPLQMRIQTKFKPEHCDLPNDVPRYATYPFKFVVKLMAARVAMLVGR